MAGIMVSSGGASPRSGFAKPIVRALFVASCLLSLVSYYTTQQGMALYLSTWFSVIASLGIQLSLVMVAWLIGFTRRDRVLLTAVYVITASVSIAFSYVSLHTWFAERERPTLMRRALFDELTAAAGSAERHFAEAAVKGRTYVTALEELTEAEKTHGGISRGADADPYINRIREAVAAEARTYDSSYREGAGAGVRYTAFDRYAKLARQAVAEMDRGVESIRATNIALRPEMPVEEQHRRFRQTYESLPWAQAAALLPGAEWEQPKPPAFADYAEKAGSGQENLMRAFEELVTAPTARHVFSLLLAAFIDIVVFLLAWSSGPYFHGDSEDHWIASAAALDDTHDQVFARDILRKFRPGRLGMPRLDAESLSAGEQQFCLLLVSKGLAVAHGDESGRSFYLVDAAVHQRLVESVSPPHFSMKAASTAS
ncbi:MAG: hypothetical protein R2729_16365 [Bryobacteraceae bacterium]